MAKEESAGSDTDKSDSAGEATDAEVYSKIREEKARIWTVNKSLSIIREGMELLARRASQEAKMFRLDFFDHRWLSCGWRNIC